MMFLVSMALTSLGCTVACIFAETAADAGAISIRVAMLICGGCGLALGALIVYAATHKVSI